MLFVITLLSFIAETKEEYNAKWMKIFYHYSGSGDYFANNIEALNSNTSNKFSILNKLNEKYQVNGKYEFLLQYPEVSGFNRWKQSYLPYDDIEILGNKAIGYEPVSISWSERKWGGLVRSNYPDRTTIDGSAGHSNWYYSIGTIKDEWWPKKIPGPAIDYDNPYYVERVSLWIRVDHLAGPTKSLKKTQFLINAISLYLALND